MTYYTRHDLPYHYALADAFTICDAYHCSRQSKRSLAFHGQAHVEGHSENVVNVIEVNIACNHATSSASPAHVLHHLGKQLARLSASDPPRPSAQPGFAPG